jgi:hypothetical protein
VAHHRQARNGNRTTPTVAKSKAEVDVGDAVEAELRIHSADRQRVRAAKGHAVALDSVDLRSGVFGELFDGPICGAETERAGDHDIRVAERRDQRPDGVAGQLHALVEEDADVSGGRLDSGVDGGGESGRRIQTQDPQPLGRPLVQPSGDARVARVVDDQGFEVGLAVGEDRQQPPFGVRLPAMDDREQRDRSRRRGLGAWPLRFEGADLAAAGPVENLPAAFRELLPDSVCGLEVTRLPALGALG